MDLYQTTKIVLIAAIIGAALARLSFMPCVKALGFTAQGILAGSEAAVIMASYGGFVTVKSICAILQSIGAAGLSATGTNIII
ncbi:hypothetical protein BGZ81_000364, partial [Podila clonocystis]